MAYQAITTKYHGPSNTRGTRISATSESMERVYISRDTSRRVQEDYARAVKSLISKLDWRLDGSWVGGNLPHGQMCWVFVPNVWCSDAGIDAPCGEAVVNG